MTEKRLFVGNIFNDPEGILKELYHRFQRFGRCISTEFERHDHFGYIDMKFDDEAAFLKLKQSFNGVKFKGNALRVDAAKMGWRERWKLDQERGQIVERAKEKQIQKSQWEHFKKLENIEMSWIDRQQLIVGRMRRTPRSRAQLRNITFRISRDGQLKVYKCHKNKLWGYERNKGPRDLVCKFTDRRYWRDGNDHIVDKLDYSRTASHWGARSDNYVQTTEDDQIEEDSSEKDKTKDVLADILGSYDFDKPLALEEDQEEDAASDYEYNALFEDSQTNGKKIETPVKRATENLPSTSEDEEQEFIPTFAPASAEAETSTNGESNVEKLRSLFSSGHQAGDFRLIDESDEDIDKEKNAPPVDVPRGEQLPVLDTHADVEGPALSSKGLFFPHFTSPFLHSQSQLAKIKSPTDHQELFANWENHYWENRAAWTKEMKSKKRDAIRQLKRKNFKAKGNVILI
ncbi:LAQU0S23e00276g1_1 [Lachancea quebecensis]|uniref:LAQU0S23e00276g1_1 n=1 Tax=Lachancea quebecensis TaxID=1654605 RepID=A0A0P1KXR4_9SACH|nr:LAQU0S23e00276g1_1 [Lachancea quebecensis]